MFPQAVTPQPYVPGVTRHGVNPVMELELMGSSNNGIGIAFLKEMELINLESVIGVGKNGIGIGKFDVELELTKWN